MSKPSLARIAFSGAQAGQVDQPGPAGLLAPFALPWRPRRSWWSWWSLWTFETTGQYECESPDDRQAHWNLIWLTAAGCETYRIRRPHNIDLTALFAASAARG